MAKIRNPREEEFEAIYNFVSCCHPLESYGVHFYRIITRYFRDTCFVAEDESGVAGFAFGLFSQINKEDFFLWQIGVASEKQGEGIGTVLIKEMEQDLRNKGAKRIELTVDLKNKPSQRLFEKNGYNIVSYKEKDTVEAEGKTAAKDFYGEGRHFILYAKVLP
ncbi:MAG: GNAT family N-acetyltransferase [Candidatus Omnitrophica bacterium]|nr:GNAT family N-acetyltransferase [Candidatus Omnitrophota bacterium]MBD3268601.1 GNAT family N-acetyltransferase [Candidatus Omnitrophota bacterium]